MADKVDVTGLDGIMAQLNSLNLSKEDKVKAVNAGAEAYIKHLVPKIPVDKDRKKGKHLNQDVTFKPGQYADGSTDVGFNKKGYYYRFLNNGTKTIKAQHFMEHAAEEAKNDINKAIADTLRSEKR
jgi:HK97 gp10 family phage protein